MRRTWPSITLEVGRERSLLNRHPWVFSGAVRGERGQPQPGDLVSVRTAEGDILGLGAYNSHSQIRVRMLTLGPDLPAGESEVDALLAARMAEALALRRGIARADTDMWRVVNAEGDGLPGLVMDLYGAELVVQPGALYLERRMDALIRAVQKHVRVDGVRLRIEKGVRTLEGLTLPEGPYRSENERPRRVSCREHGLRYEVDLEEGQKTGFFLDQRENRFAVREFAKGARALNLFGYTGGFALNLLAGGAAIVDSVDVSPSATRAGMAAAKDNGFSPESARFIETDVAHYFRQLSDTARFDVVVCDPPAFARSQKVVVEAARAYKDVNRRAMRLIDNGWLYTFSCSSMVPMKLFRQVLFQAGAEAGRRVRLVRTLGPGIDHPADLYHPEGEYLKGCLLHVRAD